MKKINLNSALFVGIDAHQEEHTAVMATRFEEERSSLRFANNTRGINQFMAWLENSQGNKTPLIGIEGGGRTRRYLVSRLLERDYPLWEINPLYTKQRRDYGTRGDKSDPLDALLVVEVLIRKLDRLPRLTLADYCSQRLTLVRLVSFWEDLARQRARIKNQLRLLLKERSLTRQPEEREILNLIIREKQKGLRQITRLEKKLKQKITACLGNPGLNLTTMKGISVILAAKIVAQTGKISKFSRVDKFIKYAGIAPLEKSSGKTKRYHKNKGGNRKLNAAFYLVALNQLRWNPEAKRYFQKKVAEGKTRKQALRCLMKRSACIVYGMLKSGKPYQT